MVEIRLQGTLKACNEAIEELKRKFLILDISKSYKHKEKRKRKGESAQVRVYINAEVRGSVTRTRQELKEMLENIAYDENIKKTIVKQLGKRITDERSKNDVSIGELAVLCGISESSLYKVEKGTGDIRTTNLIAICLALDMTLDDLVPPELYNSKYKLTYK